MTMWTEMRLLLLLLVCCALQEQSAAKECGDGFYKTQEGVCCRLCPAGTYKVMDCIVDGRKALCDLCPKDTFNDRVNQEEECSWCSSCGSGEQAVVNCSLAQDTVCRCTEGLKRDGDSGICLPEEPHPYATSVAFTAVLIFVLTALVLVIVYFNMKQKRVTVKRMLKRSGHKRVGSAAR
ncbi:tumor necrosis factor receptor superfamily member 23-like [Lampetra planeri]